MVAVKDFEELAIFQKARELSKKIYPVTNKDGSSRIIALFSRFVQPQVPSWITLQKGLKEVEIKNS